MGLAAAIASGISHLLDSWSMLTSANDPEALPQLIGEFRPVDEWQNHVNDLFYALRGSRLRDFYQTFAAADYRLAHALAADYYDRVLKRDRAQGPRSEASGAGLQSGAQRSEHGGSSLVVVELGCGNGNLAACFLTHLKNIDKDARVYSRVRYVLVDRHQSVLSGALSHPDLVEHKDRVQALCSDVTSLSGLADHSVDRIFCNELWNDLPTKLMLRRDGEIEEEYLRPNLSEQRCHEIEDWSGFFHAFNGKDLETLERVPSFLEDIIWEKEYRKTDWKAVPYRKTILEGLKKIEEHVLVPVNLGACTTLREAKRLLAPDAIGFSSFDAGTGDLKILNDSEKPCYGQFGGQYSFMVNFVLLDAVARHVGFRTSDIEAQKEFVGRSLNTNVMSLMDLLATHPTSAELKAWEQDRLVLQTIRILNDTYHSRYRRALDFPLSKATPEEKRQELQGIIVSLKPHGVPDTIAYLTEEELMSASNDLEAIGYDRDLMQTALLAPPQGVDYYHHFLSP